MKPHLSPPHCKPPCLPSPSPPKQLTPVKLASYMASRQASKGKNILSKIRSNQFVSKLQYVDITLEMKRETVLKLLARLEEEIGRKRGEVEMKTMEELFEEEKVLEGMVRMVVEGGRERWTRDIGGKQKEKERFKEKQTKKTNDKQKPSPPPPPLHPTPHTPFSTADSPISSISSKQHIEIDNPSLQKYHNDFKLTITTEKDIKPLEFRGGKRVLTEVGNHQVVGGLEVIFEKQGAASPRVSPILRNTSMSCYGGGVGDSRLGGWGNRASNKMSHLELKLESRVKFKEVKENK